MCWGLLKLQDPSGVPTDIFYAPRVDMHLPFHPGRRMHRKFLTGDQGLGHVLVQAKDPIASYKFYGVLSLTGAVEYHLQTPLGVAKPIFMRCNDRQHSIAFGVPSDKLLNHMMLEYTELNDLGLSHDTIRKRSIPVALQLGKHSNDKALTFYSASPSGWPWNWAGAPRRPEPSSSTTCSTSLVSARARTVTPPGAARRSTPSRSVPRRRAS